MGRDGRCAATVGCPPGLELQSMESFSPFLPPGFPTLPPRPPPSLPPPQRPPPLPPMAPLSPFHSMLDACGLDGVTSAGCGGETSRASIRCCKSGMPFQCFGSICSEGSHRPITNLTIGSHAATLYEASLECKAQGARLCSASELQARVCCSTCIVDE